MTVFIVANPVSGRGKAAACSEDLKGMLARHQIASELFFTNQNDQDLIDFLRRVGQKDVIVIMGGDGTFFYVINHLMQYHAVLFWGMGTTNVLTSAYQQPQTLSEVVERILRNETCHIPIGLADGKTRFAMLVSGGIDAEIMANMDQDAKNRWGKLSIVVSGLKTLWRYRFPKAKIQCDDHHCQSTMFIVSCLPNYAGAFRLFPHFEPGLFHIWLQQKPGRWRVLLFFLLLPMGLARFVPGSKIMTAAKVTISGEIRIELDGDPFDSVHKLSLSESIRLLV